MEVFLPASKSIGARFLVASFFGGTLPADPYFDDNDDLLVLQEALLEIYTDEEPIDYGQSPIDVHASGTAFRFVTAVCASTPGADYVVTGTPRLCRRPMEPLLDVLRKAGAEIEGMGEDGFGPYRITGKALDGGEFEIRGDISSQFISALMLVSPTWKKGMTLRFTTPTVSKPYIEMTARLMRQFGIEVNLSDTGVTVKPGKYVEPENFRVEADWSSASFFYEAAALGCGKVDIPGLLPAPQSLQGDARVEDIFSKLGVKSKFSEGVAEITCEEVTIEKMEMDFSDNPDIVLPFAVACLCRDVKFRFTGVSTLRHKESDRLDVLKTESAKLGYVVSYEDDVVEWTGEKCNKENDPSIDPHDDHRVAMSFAMAALKFGKIKIEHPDVVEKSFMRFWEQLPAVGLKVEENRETSAVLVLAD